MYKTLKYLPIKFNSCMYLCEYNARIYGLLSDSGYL